MGIQARRTGRVGREDGPPLTSYDETVRHRRLEERERAGSTGAGRALPGEAAPGPSGPDPFRPVGSGPGCQLGAGTALLASGSAHPDRYPRFQACRLRCGDCLDAVETIECGIRKRLLTSESFPHDQIRGVLRGRRDCLDAVETIELEPFHRDPSTEGRAPEGFLCRMCRIERWNVRILRAKIG